MGGYGSGRWRTGRTTIEECLGLSVRTVADQLKRGYGAGAVWWTVRGKETARIGYVVIDAGRGVRLQYTVTDRYTGKSQNHDYTVPVETTTPHYGGTRFWWLCPRCGRRCWKLYKPPYGARFWCRRCWNLTYRSCQDSRKYDSLYKRLGAELGMDWRNVGRLLRRRF